MPFRVKSYKFLLKTALIALFCTPLVALAVQISVPSATSYGQILIGQTSGNYIPTATSSTSFFNITTSGTSGAATYSAGTLNIPQYATGAAANFPFTPTSYGNATSTTIGFLSGLISNGSTTISGLSSGLVGNSNGLLYGFASSSLFGFTPANNATTITINGTSNQITSSAGAQDLSANRTWTLSLPQALQLPLSFTSTYGTTTYASSTALTATNFASTNATSSNLTLTGGAANCNGVSALTTNSTGVIGCTAQPQGTVTNVTATYPIQSTGGATPVISTAFGTTTTNIFSNQNTFNAQTNMLGPLVIGTSTASTTIWGATATSTFASGISLSNGGCFAIAGVCLTAGTIGGGTTQAVNWATNAVLGGTPTYANGTAGVGATLTEIGTGALSVDSNSPAVSDRVLVKNQASALQNGIYIVTATGSGIASYILTRSSDYNSPSEITPGIVTYVLTGTANTDTSWAVSYTPPLVIGTNSLTYTEAGAGTNGTVTSVAQTVPSFLSISGSPVTTSGTLAISYSGTALPISNGGSGQTSFTSSQLLYGNGTAALSSVATSSTGTVSTILALDTIGHSVVPFASSTSLSSTGGAYFALSGGNFSVGTATPEKIFTVQGAQSGGIARIERVASGVSNSKFGTYDISLKDTAGSTDLLGPAQTFSYRNLAGTVNTLADIAAYRNGADNTGVLAFSSYTAGSAVELMRLLNDVRGSVGIGTTTPRGQLNISNNTSALFPQLVLTDTNAGTNQHMVFASTTNAGGLSFGSINDAYTSLTEWARFTTAGFFGIGSTTPFSRLSIGNGTASSSVTVAEYKYGIAGNVGTSTTANIDCNASTQIAWPLGASASTLTLINMTPGKKCIVVVQNPNGTAGAITWAVQSNAILKWAGGTAPVQTTTANTYDIWSFLASSGSSTMEVIGAATLNN